jgi:hypothetical protein
MPTSNWCSSELICFPSAEIALTASSLSAISAWTMLLCRDADPPARAPKAGGTPQSADRWEKPFLPGLQPVLRLLSPLLAAVVATSRIVIGFQEERGPMRSSLPSIPNFERVTLGRTTMNFEDASSE